ncbi:MAG: hypothetical protein S4CHLAM45_03720 [Chlamydiales bacterium]|nr:hypothetical protein [Chlamydiales bacterium]MCH9619226.1 hypothetical protein [Chlamydiales bacterium]MCH9622488.1 hypothetical protein [Chlamydiales bacterium]
MLDALKTILSIQEFDIKMIRLMRVKNERKKEMDKIHSLKDDIQKRVEEKEQQIKDIKTEIRLGETQLREIQDKVVKLESQQAAVKKMDEFNALTQEMTQAGRERNTIEHQLSDLTDKQSAEDDLLVVLKENLKSTEESSKALEKEIHESIAQINEEGRALLEKREEIVVKADPEFFQIYERLLKNKKDRVVVPIEKRTCSGCHIVLTPQHENLVRKGDRLIYCEHCSRILFWQENELPTEEEESAPRRRRRRTSTTATI